MNTQKATVIAVVLLTSAGALAQDYAIRMVRPRAAGEQFKLTGSGAMSEHTTLSAQGNVIKEKKLSFKATLEATVTILAIDALKRPTKLMIHVSKSGIAKDGAAAESEAFAAGTQVVAQRRDGRREFLIAGRPVGADRAKMLGLFVSLPRSAVTDDDVFGTKARKKVGDSWAINRIIAAKDATADGLKVDAKDISGTTTLEKVHRVEGTQCLQLNATMDMTNVAPPMPPGLAVERSKMSASFSGQFPVDPALKVRSKSMKLGVSITAKGVIKPGTPEVTLSTSMTQSATKQYSSVVAPSQPPADRKRPQPKTSLPPLGL